MHQTDYVVRARQESYTYLTQNWNNASGGSGGNQTRSSQFTDRQPKSQTTVGPFKMMNISLNQVLATLN